MGRRVWVARIIDQIAANWKSRCETDLPTRASVVEFTDNLQEKNGKLYIPTLNIDVLIAPACGELETISSEAETINVCRSF